MNLDLGTEWHLLVEYGFLVVVGPSDWFSFASFVREGYLLCFSDHS